MTLWDMGHFGHRLGDVMDALAVNNSELGRRMGHKDAREVRRWRNTGTEPQMRNLRAIATALGVDPSVLTSDEPVDAMLTSPGGEAEPANLADAATNQSGQRAADAIREDVETPQDRPARRKGGRGK